MPSAALYRLLAAVLWLATMHHCILEDLGARVFGARAAQSESTATPSCPSHSDDSSRPHSEGQLCNMLMTASPVNPTVLRAVVPVFSVTFSTFASWVVNLWSAAIAPEHLTTERRLAYEKDPPLLVTQLAHSLALAPNAPPLSLR